MREISKLASIFAKIRETDLEDRATAALVLAGFNLQSNTSSLCKGFVDTPVLHRGAL